jgi:heme exporter protein A
MLTVRDLTIGRGGKRLVSGLSFDVTPGGLLQLFGGNGSGKTTLLRVVAGLLAPVRGSIAWQGAGIGECRDAFRQACAYVGHANGVHDDLTAVENLQYNLTIGSMRMPDVPRTELSARLDTALDDAGLRAASQVRAGALSQGQRRRLALAHLPISAKPLWLLDEPLAALDATGRAWFTGRMSAHLANGGMIVAATHEPFDGLDAHDRRLHLEPRAR